MSETFIHPAAVVEPGARIGEGVRIGPFCHVGENATLGDDVELMSHVSIIGHSTIGERTRVFPHAVLGAAPQDLKHKGGPTTLVVGRDCTIREHVTMHVGTDHGRGTTRVGDRVFLMVGCHIAHDCSLGDGVTMVNQASLAGHCDIGDHAIISGFTAVHQFVRIGRRAFIGGCSAVVGDVIPFGMAVGNRAKLQGFNLVGMRRSGMERQRIIRMREAYRAIFDPSQPLARNLERAAVTFADDAEAMEIIAFMTHRGKRYLTVPPYMEAGDAGDDPES